MRVAHMREQRGPSDSSTSAGSSDRPQFGASLAPLSCVELANALMTDFIERTARVSRRYLWTDAFAVCNLLGAGQLDLARSLITRVHRELGRHRDDEERHGWISGLSDSEGEAHPTLGGLRIGKPQPERRADQRFDERLEWDRDGQYFHYLTKWMDALSRAGLILNEDRFSQHSLELAKSIFPHF